MRPPFLKNWKSGMNESVPALTLQLLEWLSSHPRTYAETMEAWRSTCPRLTIWEDALSELLVQVESGDVERENQVTLSERGRAILDRCISLNIYG
jgi:hypothetical protein